MTEGEHAGRWADPHNARPAYHYIMARGIAALLGVMPADDPDRPEVVECLRLALRARNPEFTARGVMNKDSAVEALLLVDRLPPPTRDELGDCGTDEALAVLGRLISTEFRAGRMSLSPGVAGGFFEAVVAGEVPSSSGAGDRASAP